MLMSLTESEMLDLWKLRVGLTPALRDCSVERDDGLDLDSKLTTDIRQWYATLLATAPVEWLPVEDVAADVTATTDSSGVVTATMPDRAVRPVEWHLDGWASDAVEFHSPTSVTAKQQAVEWLRGGGSRPVAVLGQNQLKLYSVDPGTEGTVDKALCVVMPDDGSYQFSQEALATLPACPGPEWS